MRNQYENGFIAQTKDGQELAQVSGKEFFKVKEELRELLSKIAFDNIFVVRKNGSNVSEFGQAYRFPNEEEIYFNSPYGVYGR